MPHPPANAAQIGQPTISCAIYRTNGGRVAAISIASVALLGGVAAGQAADTVTRPKAIPMSPQAVQRTGQAESPLGLVVRVEDGTVCKIDSKTVGLEVIEVSPGGPATEAGIEVGDIVLRLGDVETRSRADWDNAAKRLRKGKKVALSFVPYKSHSEDAATASDTHTAWLTPWQKPRSKTEETPPQRAIRPPVTVVRTRWIDTEEGQSPVLRVLLRNNRKNPIASGVMRTVFGCIYRDTAGQNSIFHQPIPPGEETEYAITFIAMRSDRPVELTVDYLKFTDGTEWRKHESDQPHIVVPPAKP